jgi:hypothetical protein
VEGRQLLGSRSGAPLLASLLTLPPAAGPTQSGFPPALGITLSLSLLRGHLSPRGRLGGLPGATTLATLLGRDGLG